MLCPGEEVHQPPKEELSRCSQEDSFLLSKEDLQQETQTKVSQCSSASAREGELVMYQRSLNCLCLQKCFHVPKTHCENVPVKNPVSGSILSQSV